MEGLPSENQNGSKVEGQASGGRVVSHHWVVSTRFLSSSLLLAASQTESSVSRLSFFDCDGELFNEASIELTPGRVGVFELNPFMADVKLESGFRHAHLVLETGRGVLSTSQIHTSEGGAIMGAVDLISSHRPVFCPVRISESLSAYVAIINQGEKDAETKVRLFLGKRSPESTVTIPGKGCRIVSLRDEFTEFFPDSERGPSQGYIRITTRSDEKLGFQVLEKHLGSNGGTVFCTLS